MEKIVLQNAAEVSKIGALLNPISGDRLYIGTGAAGYVFFALPVFPQGALVSKATLRMEPVGKSGQNVQVTVSAHKITQPWAVDLSTGVPTTGALVDSETHTGNMVYELDVTADIVAAQAGGVWFGWRLTSNFPENYYAVYGTRSEKPMRLEIEYVSPPPAPTDLEPRNDNETPKAKPILSWTFQGFSANTYPVAHQVQLATDANFANITHDSGSTPGPESMHDLDNGNFAGLALNVATYWRVRVKNDSGLWSAWSPGGRFKYTGPKAVAITSPGASTPDPTPDITWTYDGTQASYEVLLEILDQATGNWSQTYSSGQKVSTNTRTLTLPPGAIMVPQATYRVTVKVHAATAVAVLPGSESAMSVTKTFSWIPSGAQPPTDIEVLSSAPVPNKIVRWYYDGPAATTFMIYRTTSTGAPTVQIPVTPEAAREGTTNWYRYEDRLVPGRADVSWEVQTVTSAGSSAFNPVETLSVRNAVPWVVSVRDPSRAFNLVDPDIDPGLSEISEVVVPVAGSPYLVQQSLQGFMGQAGGTITWEVSYADLDGQEMIDNFKWMRANPEVYFTWQDQAIRAFLYNMAFTPFGRADGKTDYDVSFNFVEV